MMLLDMLLPTYVQMLGALSTWLIKAAPQRPGGKGDALLAARLAPDMFPLSTQVRFACRQAQERVSRIQGRAFPASLQALLDEDRNGGEAPGTIAAARGRIAESLAVVEAAAAEGVAVVLRATGMSPAGRQRLTLGSANLRVTNFRRLSGVGARPLQRWCSGEDD